MSPKKALVLAAAGGLLQTLSFAPFGWWPLQVGGIALLFFALKDAPPKRAALLGWLFAFAWLTSSVFWVYISMHRYGGMPAPMAALATALLGGGLGLYYALAAAAWAWWAQAGRRGAAFPALGFAAWWTLAELARATLFTGFPWSAGGYAHTDGVLAGWAPWIGVYGIGFVAAWWGAAIGNGRLRGIAVPTLVALAGLGLPQDFTRSTGRLEVSLLQPAVPQELKFDPAQFERVLTWHVQALREAPGTLVVTPESSIPLPAALVDPAWADAMREPFLGGGRAALVGLFTGDDVAGHTNSLVALSATSSLHARDAYVYGKRHLLPFGEFIPPGFRWFVDAMSIPIGDQAHGRSEAPIAVGGQRVRPLICYEDLFGEDFAGSVVGDGAATVFANATNLAWFGPWLVQDQHLQFSRMRALEFQRPVVRATNTGSTAAVAFDGRVTDRLPPGQPGVLNATVEGRTGATPYARWLAAQGLWPLAAVLLALLLRGGGRAARL